MDKTPSHVVQTLLFMIAALIQRIHELEAKLGEDSSNSNQPPSNDPPFSRPQRNSSQDKGQGSRNSPGGQPGHKGHKQKLLEPTESKHVYPQEECECGSPEFEDQGVFYIHQEVELPEIQLDIRHFHLHEGKCTSCGRLHKSQAPRGHRTGYGPRFSALIALLSGDHGDSRQTVQRFCLQLLGLHLSIGTIQKIINRSSRAIWPHYEAIREKARQAQVNHVDETPWYQARAALHWLWVLCNSQVAFFMIQAKRNKEAFKTLIDKWTGILVSDDYGVYRKWVNLNQSCLSHLVRRAKALAQMKDPEIARCGAWASKELYRLMAMANAPPTKGQWRAFYARFYRLLKLYRDREDQAGTFVRSLERLHESLWTFLMVEGVEPTNNLAERMLRRAVLWRKRSMGTESETGDRWVERVLTLTQTCRLQNKLCFPVLVQAMEAYFYVKEPDLSWIEQIKV